MTLDLLIAMTATAGAAIVIAVLSLSIPASGFRPGLVSQRC